MGSKCQNSFFLEHGHVAYQIKGNHGCSNMVENSLAGNPLQTPLLPWGSKGQNQIFTEYDHIILNRFSNSETWQQLFCLHTFSLPHSTLGVGLKVKIQLENMVMLHMKLNRIAKAATCKYFGRKSPLLDFHVRM